MVEVISAVEAMMKGTSNWKNCAGCLCHLRAAAQLLQRHAMPSITLASSGTCRCVDIRGAYSQDIRSL